MTERERELLELRGVISSGVFRGIMTAFFVFAAIGIALGILRAAVGSAWN
jgi:hypothetical protein